MGAAPGDAMIDLCGSVDPDLHPQPGDEVVVRGTGEERRSEWGRGPLEALQFSVQVPGQVRLVVVELLRDGQRVGARVVSVDGSATDAGELSERSTALTLIWQGLAQAGLPASIEFLASMIPTDATRILGMGTGRERAQTRSAIEAALGATIAVRDAWEQRTFAPWPELPEGVEAPVQAAARASIVLGVWRCALRVTGVSQAMCRATGSASVRAETRPMERAMQALAPALAQDDVVLPLSSGLHPAPEAWRSMVLGAVREEGGELAISTTYAVEACVEAVAWLDDDLQTLTDAWMGHLDAPKLARAVVSRGLARQAELRKELECVADSLPGGWAMAVAMWLAHLAGRGMQTGPIEQDTEPIRRGG